jgi:hypothetical protein
MGGGATIGAPVIFTGRRTSLPGCKRGARTVTASPSSRWNRGANRMYPNTMRMATRMPKATSNTTIP